MEKAEINRQLRALVEERLFGNGPWGSNAVAAQAAIERYQRRKEAKP